MICRYTASAITPFPCPLFSGFTGQTFNNTQAYVSNVNLSVTGEGTYTSYLSKVDAILNAESAALTGGSLPQSETGCLYRVFVFYTGFCPGGSPNPSFFISGSATGADPYIAYINAFLLLTGLASGAGGACGL